MGSHFKCIQAFRRLNLTKLLFFFAMMLSTQIALCDPALTDSLDTALQEIDTGNYELAFNQLEPLAKQDNAQSQYLIGFMLIDSYKDKQKGVYWLEQAVKNRHAKAAQTLSKMYLSGMIVPYDMQKGTKYLMLAEEFHPPEEPEEECD